MKSVCSKCGEEKEKVRGKRKSGGMAYKYHDELGRYWNGGTCPSCHSKYTTSRHRRKVTSERLAKIEGNNGNT